MKQALVLHSGRLFPKVLSNMLTESNLRAACGLRRRQSFSALGMARAVPDSPADVSHEGVLKCATSLQEQRDAVAHLSGADIYSLKCPLLYRSVKPHPPDMNGGALIHVSIPGCDGCSPAV